MGAVMAFAREKERPGICAPPLNADKSSPVLTVAISPVVMRATEDGRFEAEIVCMLACDYDVFVVMGMVFRLFNHAPKRVEVIHVPIMTLNGCGREVCTKPSIYVFKQICRYFVHLSE